MAKFDKKLQAQSRRRTGKSINVIAQELGVSKSTVSVWCRDLVLTAAEQARIRKKAYAAGHQGRLAGARKNRQDKERRIAFAKQEALRLLGTVSDRDRFLLGIGLYWGEGVKTTQSTTAFINADPQAVCFMKQWFNEFMDVSDDRFNPYIFISHTHADRIDTVKQFWSQRLALPITQFRKVVYLQSTPKKVYENRDVYYGTVALRIRRSTDLKYKILELVEQFKMPT